MTRTPVLATLLVALAIGLTLPFTPTDASDYDNSGCAHHLCDDAAPAIDALQRGHVAEFFREQPAMGSFSLIVRAPAAAVARALGGDQGAQYRAGAFICVLAAVVLALLAAREAARRGASTAAVVTLAALVVINPASGDALQRGHPEEVLAGSLLAGAALIARRRPLLAGVLLGLLPVAFLAADSRRLRLVAVSVGVTALLLLPMAAGNTSAFRDAFSAAANPPGTVKPIDIWFLAAHSEQHALRLPDGSISVNKIWTMPRVLDRAAHWLVIAICAGLTALWWWRRDQAGSAVWLLALILLLRVVLDPRAHPYHLTPFVLSLAAVEAMVVARFPWRILAASAALAVTLRLFDDGHYHAANAVFLIVALPAACALAAAAFRPREREPSAALSRAAP